MNNQNSKFEYKYQRQLCQLQERAVIEDWEQFLIRKKFNKEYKMSVNYSPNKGF